MIQDPSSMTLTDKLYAYMQLTRFDKPVGIELLLWPTLWGVMLAAMGKAQQQAMPAGLPTLKIFILFALGAVFMRAAGCAINDFADRKVDGHVTRTKNRPLADGRLSAKEAIAAFFVLVILSVSLLLFLPIEVFYWSFGAIILAFIYPFMKRYTQLPQVFLAAAFGSGTPMAYVAVQGTPDIWCWLLFFAYMCWTVAYDTQYAMADRDDDLKIGIKSTAILFGRYDVIIISILQMLFLLIMGAVLWHYFEPTSLSMIPIFGLGLIAMMFAKQNSACASRQAIPCFKAFLANIWVGRYAFAIIAIACMWTTFNG